MVALAGKGKIEALAASVAKIGSPEGLLKLSQAFAAQAETFIFTDLGKLKKRSGKLASGTSVDEVNSAGFRMKSTAEYAGTHNWGTKRIVRLIAYVITATGPRFVKKSRIGQPLVRIMMVSPVYRKRSFIPARRMPAKYIKRYQAIADAQVAAAVKV